MTRQVSEQKRWHFTEIRAARHLKKAAKYRGALELIQSQLIEGATSKELMILEIEILLKKIGEI